MAIVSHLPATYCRSDTLVLDTGTRLQGVTLCALSNIFDYGIFKLIKQKGNMNIIEIQEQLELYQKLHKGSLEIQKKHEKELSTLKYYLTKLTETCMSLEKRIRKQETK